MVFSEGKNWSVQRKWMMSTLAKLGLNNRKGDNIMEEVISGQVREFCERISDQASQGPIQVKERLDPMAINIVMGLTTGKANK